MLVLTRKVGESIVFPHLGIEVTVLGVQSNKVRLGIRAPLDIQIVRQEIMERGRDKAHEHALAAR
jgi:carbon storage regulator